MESTEQRDGNLIKAIPGATRPDSQKPIPLTDDFKQTGVDISHVVGSTYDELMSGEGGDTRDRVAIPGNPVRFLKEKLRKKFHGSNTK